MAVAVLPVPSMTVHVTTVAPNGNVAGASLVVLATLQLSAVVGVPNATPVASQLAASTFTVTAAGAVIVGSMSSTTVNCLCGRGGIACAVCNGPCHDCIP